MSILQKGTVTVVVATVIASGMIVLTGNGVAEDKGKIKSDAENIVSSKETDVIPKKLTQIEKQTDETVTKASIPLAPPPGPFLSEDGVVSAQKSLLAPVAPKAPSNLSKQPDQPANSLHFKAEPSLSQRAVEPKGELNEPFAPKRQSITPKLSPSAPQIDQKMKPASSGQPAKQAAMPKSKAFDTPAPVVPKNMTKQPEIRSEDVPIWGKGGSVTREGLNSSSKNTTRHNQAVMGMPNMSWNNNSPAQQYMYVPVPMMPSNMTPPQMPTFNGNIVPPSNYRGAPMPPNNTPNTLMQKESTGDTSAPVQKGSK